MNVYLLIFNWIIIIILIICIVLNDALNYDLFDDEEHLNLKNILKINDSYNNNHNLFQNQIWINEMTKNGAIVIPNILSNSDCDSILKIIEEEKNCNTNFHQEIRSNQNREYIMLPLQNTIPFVTKIYMQLKHFCDTLLPNPKLLETSSFTTYKGSLQQRFHVDGIWKGDYNTFTFGIALDDITEDMGPLEFFIGSHNISSDISIDSISDKYNLPIDEYTREQEMIDDPIDGYQYNILEEACKAINLKNKKCTCKKGSLIIWSWQVIHRGTENNNKIRPIFYFTMKDGNLKFLDGIRHNSRKKRDLTYILSEYDKKYDFFYK